MSANTTAAISKRHRDLARELAAKDQTLKGVVEQAIEEMAERNGGGKATKWAELRRFRVNATVAGGKFLGEVEARSRDETISRAFDLDSSGITLCHICSEQCEDAEIVKLMFEPVGEGQAFEVET